jgi:DNA-binding protein YbaB
MEIASWLEKTYRNPPHQKLTGIIYLQALTDRRIYGSTLRNLKMFRELCGEDPLKNVVFATTGWGTAARAGDLEKAKINEEQLRTDPDFWEPFIRRGSTIARFEDTMKSALEIILSLADRAPTVLQIQQEMVDEDKDLVDTSAGHAVNEELRKLEEKYQKDLNALQTDMEQALAEKDLDLQSALAESKASIEKLRDEARHAQDILQYERRNERRKYENDMQALQQRMTRDLKKEKKEQELRHRAELIQQNMKFDEVVKQLKDNEHLLRREEREAMERRIDEMEERHRAEIQNAQSQEDSGSGTDLLMSLLPLVGSFAMSLMGFPF